MMIFAKTLRRLLLEHNLSVAQLSAKTGVPAKTIYHWMTGQQPRKMEHLFKICDVLGVSVEELFGRAPKVGASVLPSRTIDHELLAGVYEVILRPAPKNVSTTQEE